MLNEFLSANVSLPTPPPQHDELSAHVIDDFNFFGAVLSAVGFFILVISVTYTLDKLDRVIRLTDPRDLGPDRSTVIMHVQAVVKNR